MFHKKTHNQSVHVDSTYIMIISFCLNIWITHKWFAMETFMHCTINITDWLYVLYNSGVLACMAPCRRRAVPRDGPYICHWYDHSYVMVFHVTDVLFDIHQLWWHFKYFIILKHMSGWFDVEQESAAGLRYNMTYCDSYSKWLMFSMEC